ncbi:MAG: hypothetical protein FWH04_08915 [Oscillospiraceae bacterium]|nr:hypothetical protein [Oscillospiraceae bacterium]
MRYSAFIMLAILGGLAAAVLRALQITSTIEIETGLVRPGQAMTFAVPIAVVVFAALIIVLIIARKAPEPGSSQPLGISWITVEGMAAGFMASVGIAEFFGGLEAVDTIEGPMYGRLAFGAVTVAASLCVLLVAVHTYRGRIKASALYGLWATIPVLWAAFALIMNYWRHSGEPVLTAYIYGTIALVFFSLAILGLAGFYFRKFRYKRTLFYTLMSIFMVILAVGGFFLALVFQKHPDTIAAMAELLPGEEPPWLVTVFDVKIPMHPDSIPSLTEFLMYGFMFCHMLAVGLGITAGVYNFESGKPEEENEQELPEGDISS